MNLEGKLLGNRYEIIEKIGIGGMATVYKARCHVLNRYVAVKVLKDEFTTDEEFIKRFAAEAQSAASLTHPNIVSIYDVGNEGNLYYIVMELIKGKTLKEIINEGDKLPWKWSVNIAIQMASALETAHKNHIVHRDIKPHNIIITEDGIAKVTDFGIAKAVSNSTITAFGTTIGSVHYFSPEHARGGFTDAKSDIYSLGVVMYEMLTGRVPFDADTPVSIALKHMQEDPIEPVKLNPEIPTAINKIIMKAMKKDINLRYQTATEILRDLNKAQKDPNGNFVFMQNENDFATQKIPIYNNIDKAEESSRVGRRSKKENKLKTFINNHKILSYLLGAILLFALVLGTITVIGKVMKGEDVQIPNLVNSTKQEVELLAEELGIELIFKEEYNATVEEGRVISQDPKYIENYKIKRKNTPITVVISKGQETTSMPKLIGLTKEEAIQELAKAKLTPEFVEEIYEKMQQGYVFNQDPATNTTLNAGDKVKVYVSLGTGIVETTVPAVIGKTEEEAKKLITDANLKVEIVNEEDSTKDTGIVLKQSKDAGTTIAEGTVITITVNKVAESKTASITVDVKSITGGYTESTDENTVTEKEYVTVKVNVVSGDGKGFTRSKVDKNGTASGSVTGKGRITIEAVITDNTGTVLWSESHPMNLDSETSYTFK